MSVQFPKVLWNTRTKTIRSHLSKYDLISPLKARSYFCMWYIAILNPLIQKCEGP